MVFRVFSPMLFFDRKGIYMNIRLANQNDIQHILYLMHEAKAFLASQNIDQWQNEYPSKTDILQDLEQKNGYVVCDDTEIVGYVCISFDEEHCYNKINGNWLSNQKYATLHRVAVQNQKKGKGLAGKMFCFAEQICKKKGIKSIRIDTEKRNQLMQRAIEKQGFMYCGVVYLDGGERIAFEKLLP